MKDISYTIMNPFSAEIIMERIPESQVDSMVRYFAWLLGVRVSSISVKKFPTKPLTGARR